MSTITELEIKLEKQQKHAKENALLLKKWASEKDITYTTVMLNKLLAENMVRNFTNMLEIMEQILHLQNEK